MIDKLFYTDYNQLIEVANVVIGSNTFIDKLFGVKTGILKEIKQK